MTTPLRCPSRRAECRRIDTTEKASEATTRRVRVETAPALSRALGAPGEAHCATQATTTRSQQDGRAEESQRGARCGSGRRPLRPLDLHLCQDLLMCYGPVAQQHDGVKQVVTEGG